MTKFNDPVKYSRRRANFELNDAQADLERRLCEKSQLLLVGSVVTQTLYRALAVFQFVMIAVVAFASDP